MNKENDIIKNTLELDLEDYNLLNEITTIQAISKYKETKEAMYLQHIYTLNKKYILKHISNIYINKVKYNITEEDLLSTFVVSLERAVYNFDFNRSSDIINLAKKYFENDLKRLCSNNKRDIVDIIDNEYIVYLNDDLETLDLLKFLKKKMKNDEYRYCELVLLNEYTDDRDIRKELNYNYSKFRWLKSRLRRNIKDLLKEYNDLLESY